MSADWILNHLPCSMHSESFLIWTIGLNGFSRTGTVPYPLLLISLTFLKPPSDFKVGLFSHALRPIKRCGSLTAYLDPSISFIEYSFPVVAVDPGKSFVLKNWGCFLLNKINSTQTRLIVRTHGQVLTSWKDYLEYFFMMPLHYLMERRMLAGIKSRSEVGPGEPFSATNDILWFIGIILSYILTTSIRIIHSSRLPQGPAGKHARQAPPRT